MNYFQLSINCQFDKLAIDLLVLRFDKTGLHQVHLSKGNRPVIFLHFAFLSRRVRQSINAKIDRCVADLILAANAKELKPEKTQNRFWKLWQKLYLAGNLTFRHFLNPFR